MGAYHGFYLPFVRYLKDPVALVHYLGQKVGTGNSCIQCHRMYGSLDAVRKHMTMTPHTLLQPDDILDEYLEFYDFERDENAVETMDVDEATEVVGGEEEAGEGATSSSSSASSAVVVSHGFGMKVHSGTIGHRELRVYYRQ